MSEFHTLDPPPYIYKFIPLSVSARNEYNIWRE
jgi:hypothetical protein